MSDVLPSRRLRASMCLPRSEPSSGERQCVAPARAHESRVRETIERLHGDLTMVVIGHRLALLERADHVVLLERGRIRVQGRWDDVASHWMGAR